MAGSKLDGNFWGGDRIGGVGPGNGGQVKTTNPQPGPFEPWRSEGGSLEPSPGGVPGSGPGGPAPGEPVWPESGRRVA